MSERWQQWMPFHIDRWKGSAHVQAMPAAARAGYLYLLGAAWQGEDCSLPNDDEELQVVSGLTVDEWQQHGTRILRRFKERADGRLENKVLVTEWEIAKMMTLMQRAAQESLSEKRSTAGRTGAERRWKSRRVLANACQSDSKPMANDGLTETETSTETETGTEQQRPVAASAAASAACGAQLGALPLTDGTEYAICEDDLRRDQELFPAVDVRQEYRGMKSWLLSDRRRWKTRSGVRKFMHNWLSKAQNSGRASATAVTTTRPDATLGTFRPGDIEASLAREEQRRQEMLEAWRSIRVENPKMFGNQAPPWIKQALDAEASNVSV